MSLLKLEFYDGDIKQNKPVRSDMKLNKLSFLAGAVALTLTAIPFAAEANRANINSSSPVIVARGGKGMRMLKRLNLTDQQKTQLQEIKKSARDEMKEILTPEQLQKLQEAKANGQKKREVWGNLGLTDDQKAEIKEIRESKKSQIEAILTDDQKQQLEQMRQNRRNRRQQSDS